MFAVVSGILNNDVFVVPKIWIFQDSKKGSCTFYPEKGKIKSLVVNCIEPENDWSIVEVLVLKDNINSYQLAHASMLTRTNYTNTSSENEAKTKANRHKVAAKRYSSDEYDFNTYLHKKQKPTEVKSKTTKNIKKPKIKDTTSNPSNQYPKSEAMFELSQPNTSKTILSPDNDYLKKINEIEPSLNHNDVSSQEFNDSPPSLVNPSNEYGENSNSFSMSPANQNSSSIIAQFSRFEEENVSALSKNQFLVLSEKIDDLKAVVLDMNKKMSKMNAINSADEDFCPEPIRSIEELKERENFLLNSSKSSNDHHRTLKNNLVAFYFPKLRNKNSRGENKYGLMACLCNLYFDKELIPMLGWSSYMNRCAIKNFDGHFQLFYEIVNKNSPNMYTNITEAAEQVQEFLRRFHEIINKAARVSRQAQEKTN